MTKKQKQRKINKKKGLHTPVPARGQITAPLARKEKDPSRTVELRMLMNFPKRRTQELGKVNISIDFGSAGEYKTNDKIRYVDENGIVYSSNPKREKN